MSCAAALIAVDMQCNQNLKCELEIQRGRGGGERERQRVLYNKVARQHCVWVIWHSFRFAHKHVNTFHVVFFLIRSTLPASFYDKQNACKSRILQTINVLRQAAACLPALRWQQVPPPLSLSLSLSLLCHTIYATCCVCVCVAETNPTNAQMRMCTHSMLIFLFPTANPLFMHKSNRKH